MYNELLLQRSSGGVDGHQDAGREPVQRRLSHAKRLQADPQVRRANLIRKCAFLNFTQVCKEFLNFAHENVQF